MNPGSCAFEVFFVRIPVGDPLGNDQIWSQVDETRIDLATREELAANGFRVGVVGAQLPEGLAQLLQIKHEACTADSGTEEEDVGFSVAALGEEPQVVRRHLQVPPGQRREIYLTPPRDQFTVLTASSKGCRGRSYELGQPALALRWFCDTQRKCMVELTPEIHFGQSRTRFAAEEGNFRIEVTRSKESFDQLRLRVGISPGEILILGCYPERPGSLGHGAFVLHDEDRQEQRLLLIRLVQIQHDELFSPDQVRKWTESS